MTARTLRPSMQFHGGFLQLYNEYCDTERGQKLLQLSGISREQLDIPAMTQKYFEIHTGDMSVDANANVGDAKCPNNFSTEVVKGVSKMTAFHLLWTRLATDHGEEEASELIGKLWNGHYYFHDLTGHGVTAPYCFAASTIQLIFQGRPYGQLHSLPPKRSQSFISQAIEYTMDLSQEFMGAIALGDLLVNYAMMCQDEGMDPSTEQGRGHIKNGLQQFVHVVNNKFRTGAQSPFTNVSIFDRPQLETLFKEYEYPWGAKAQDHIDYIMTVQALFLELMAAKDPVSKTPYRFPVTTVNLTTDKGKIQDPEFLKLVCRYNVEGLFNVYITDGLGKVASCCRLLSDVRVIRERPRADVWGNGGLNIGSTRVCTINLARLALKTEGPTEFKAALKRAVTDVTKLLATHREILSDLSGTGYLKFFSPLGWISMDMLFSTIGVLGLYEALEIFGEKYRLPSRQGVKKAEEILKYIDEIALKQTEKMNIPFNVEQIPAESAAIKLAKADKLFFPKSPYDIYSNQSIPLWIDVDLVTRARVDGALNRCYSGGGISHLNIGSAVTPGQMEKLIRFAVECGLDHFALNPVFSTCENEHVTLGSPEKCPLCGGKIVSRETRVVGYFTSVGDWTEVRRVWEFPRRVWMMIDECEVMREPETVSAN